jgi:hypothetical protein
MWPRSCLLQYEVRPHSLAAGLVRLAVDRGLCRLSLQQLPWYSALGVTDNFLTATACPPSSNLNLLFVCQRHYTPTPASSVLCTVIRSWCGPTVDPPRSSQARLRPWAGGDSHCERYLPIVGSYSWLSGELKNSQAIQHTSQGVDHKPGTPPIVRYQLNKVYGLSCLRMHSVACVHVAPMASSDRCSSHSRLWFQPAEA